MKNLMKMFLASVLLVCSACSGKGSESASAEASSASETPEETVEPTPTPEPVVSTATLFMCGDALLHMTINYDAEQGDGTYDYSSMLSHLKPIAQSYDLAYYNQETILAGVDYGLSGYPMFNSPQDWGDYMVDAGFDLVSTANNHSLDRGVDGIESSLNYWDTKDVIVAGTARTQEEADTIKYGEVNGIKFAFLSWAENTNGILAPEGYGFCVNTFGNDNEQQMLDQIAEAHANADVVILAIHWGVEYQMYPADYQIELAQQVADAGADIIIGNHPHVIEPVQWIGDSICFYALGNIIAAQYDESRIGMLAGLTITKTEDAIGSSIEISDVHCDLHYTYYDSNIQNFDIIPFSQLDDDHLYGYQDVYNQYVGVITEMDDSITVGGF